VKLRLAAVPSVFPALSVALTSKVWGPGDSGFGGVCLAPGPEQGPYGWESKRHRKVEPASLELKVKVGLRPEAPVGPDVIVVCGAVESST
jgi:hypothetical protein